MQYVLAGFTQDTGFRVFSFERVADDWARTPYSVKADLALARKYRIPMQELPLLCRGVLERHSEDDDARAFTLTEEDMTVQADLVRAAIEANKRKAPRRHFTAPTSESTSPVQPA